MPGEPQTIVLARPNAGGVAHVAERVVAELRRDGTRVLDVSLAEEGAPAWTGLGAAIRLRHALRTASVVHIELGRTVSAPFWFGVAAMALRRDVIVVAHDAPVLNTAPGAGLVSARHGWRDAVAHRIVAPLVNRPVTAFVRRRIGTAVVLNAKTRSACNAVGLNRVSVIEHGADEPVPGPLPSVAQAVVFGGFLAPDKGLEDLLDAWQTVGSTSTATLRIAGAASRQHQAWAEGLRDRSDRMANAPQWLGYLDDAAFHELIASAAVVVLPYRASNPASGIVIRAMVQGRAIIATRVPAMESALEDGTTGVLVGVQDTTSLARQLTALLDDPERRDRLGAAAARVASVRHTWRNHVSGLRRVYHTQGARP